MYSIFVNDTCIYDDTSSDLSLKIIDGSLSLEDNSAGSLSMTLPITSAGYDITKRMACHVIVKRDGVKIWGGRPLSDSEDFYKNKVIACEGELAYLNDTFQPLEEYYGLTLYQFLEVILHVHNNKCNGDEKFDSYSNPPETRNVQKIKNRNCVVTDSTYDKYRSYDTAHAKTYPTPTDGKGETSSVTGHLDKRIYLGSVTVTDTTNNEYRCTNYVSTLDVIMGLVERLGGHVRIRTGDDGKLYLDYLKDYQNRSSQTVKLGQNLLDYQKDYDMSNLCTVLLPLGAKKNTEDLVGEEKKTHWNRNSYIDPVGRVRLGKYFYRTDYIPVEKQSTWIEYDSSTGNYTDRVITNSLTYSGEQVAGYNYVFFYDENQRPITGSGKSAQATDANPADKGTEIFRDAVISIPDNAKYAVFGFYFGGEKNTAPFQVAFNSGESWWRYTNVSFLHGDLVGTAGYIVDNYGGFINPVDDSYVVSDPILVKEKEIYFITSRQNNGYGMFCVYLQDGTPISAPSTAGTGVGFTDWEKQKQEMPTGAYHMIVGGKTGVELNPIVYTNYKARSDYYDPPDEYVTIESVNGGSLYLKNTALIRKYGWIEKQAVWDDMDTPTKLKARAQEYLSNTQFDDMVLELKAYDMHLVNDTVPAINILDKVQCVSIPHSFNATLPVTKLEIPLTDPANATYTLGEEKKNSPTLTGDSVASDLELFRKLDEVPKPSAILNAAKANATSLINMQSESFVQLTDNELLIMDAPDKESCTRLWRMNVNGIGYSNTGYSGTYGLAMTMDGAIVADRITTGYMHADRIRGGTLTLGGYDNTDGEFYMKNAKGRNFVKMSKDGAEMICKILQPVRMRSWVGTTDSYGMIEMDKGNITSYSATIKVPVDSRSDSNWFDDYSFSFSDVTAKTKLTRIETVACLEYSSDNKPQYGMRLASNVGFQLWCATPSEVDQNAHQSKPSFQMSQTGSGELVFQQKNTASYVGMMYVPTHDIPIYHTVSGQNKWSYTGKTLCFRNDDKPSGSRGIHYGGISLYSSGGPISLDGTDIYIRGATFNVARGAQLLTGLTGSFSVVVGMDNGSPRTGTISIVDGFVVAFDGNDSGGDGYGDQWSIH